MHKENCQQAVIFKFESFGKIEKRENGKKMEEKRKIRSSNIELMRIFAMLMIITYHIVCHCVRVQVTDANSIARMQNGVFSHPVFYGKLGLLELIMSHGDTGNAIFIMASGYFLVSKGNQINLINTAKKLLTQLGFATLVLLLASTVSYWLENDGGYIELTDASRFNKNSWFVGYYFVVALLGKAFLNEVLLKMEKKRYAEFLLALFAITQFTWSGDLMENLASGFRTLGIGAFLYALGGYIKMYNPFDRLRAEVLPVIVLAVEGIVFISYYNTVTLSIEKYQRGGGEGDFIQQLPTFGTYHIVPVILGITIFEIFRRVHIKPNKIVNFLGKATFMVYLMHDNPFFYSLWDRQDWATLLHGSLKKFSWKMLQWVLITFAIGVAAYGLYLLLAQIAKKGKRLLVKS